MVLLFKKLPRNFDTMSDETIKPTDQEKYSSRDAKGWVELGEIWKDLPHPFFIVLKSLLDQEVRDLGQVHGLGLLQLAEKFNFEFDEENKPDAIVIGTGSNRKLAIFISTLVDLDIPFAAPRETRPP